MSCGPQQYGDDEINECEADSCKLGFCDGTGACEMKPPFTDCGVCSLCDGAGNCSIYDESQNSDCDYLDSVNGHDRMYQIWSLKSVPPESNSG